VLCLSVLHKTRKYLGAEGCVRNRGKCFEIRAAEECANCGRAVRCAHLIHFYYYGRLLWHVAVSAGNYLEFLFHPTLDGRIILRWVFRKWEGVVGTG
jgi:hypothetical protein